MFRRTVQMKFMAQLTLNSLAGQQDKISPPQTSGLKPYQNLTPTLRHEQTI